MTAKIQPARIEDVEGIYSILKGFNRPAYTKDLITDLINNKDSICLKITDNGKIIASLGARAEGRDAFWIYFVAVRIEYRRKGYARQLMEKFFEEAKNKGAKRVAVDTPEKELFERFGFMEVGRLPKWQGERDQIIMFREI